MLGADHDNNTICIVMSSPFPITRMFGTNNVVLMLFWFNVGNKRYFVVLRWTLALDPWLSLIVFNMSQVINITIHDCTSQAQVTTET